MTLSFCILSWILALLSVSITSMKNQNPRKTVHDQLHQNQVKNPKGKQWRVTDPLTPNITHRFVSFLFFLSQPVIWLFFVINNLIPDPLLSIGGISFFQCFYLIWMSPFLQLFCESSLIRLWKWWHCIVLKSVQLTLHSFYFVCNYTVTRSDRSYLLPLTDWSSHSNHTRQGYSGMGTCLFTAWIPGFTSRRIFQ